MLTPRVKLADVAKVVGVSTATVSRVVNGKPGVAEATRTAVLAGLFIGRIARILRVRDARLADLRQQAAEAGSNGPRNLRDELPPRY